MHLILHFGTMDTMRWSMGGAGGGNGIGLTCYHGRTSFWTDNRRSINRILSWHYIFWFSLPLLVIGLLIGLKYLKYVTDVTKPRIDLLSVLFSTIGFGGVVFGFSKAGEGSEGWSSMVVIIILKLHLNVKFK